MPWGWPWPNADCGCCTTDCPCPTSPPYYKFTFPTRTNGSCSDCDALGGLVIGLAPQNVGSSFPCSWLQCVIPFADPICGGIYTNNGLEIQLSLIGSAMILSISDTTGAYLATYSTAADFWSCLGTNTMWLSATNGTQCNWPSTIAVSATDPSVCNPSYYFNTCGMCQDVPATLVGTLTAVPSSLCYLDGIDVTLFNSGNGGWYGEFTAVHKWILLVSCRNDGTISVGLFTPLFGLCAFADSVSFIHSCTPFFATISLQSGGLGFPCDTCESSVLTLTLTE